MKIRLILAVTDFSPSADLAIERAAQLAVLHGAELRLLHLPPHAEAPPEDALRRLKHTARSLRLRLAIDVTAANSSAGSLRQVAAAASAADLLVLGHQRERPLAALLFGSTASQLARLCRCPVLVAKLPVRDHYRRVLASIDFSPASKRLAGLAFRIDEEAEVQLFHAISGLDEAKLRSAEVSLKAIKSYRKECMRHAHNRMFLLSDSFDTRRNRVISSIGHGDPARQAVVQQEHIGADLLVVGMQRKNWLADLVFGSAAQQVLDSASCDVMVVPEHAEPASRTAARQRMEAERADGRSAFGSTRRKPS